MIAVDTNLLVYAHRPEAPLHQQAYAKLGQLASYRALWGIPCHVLVEFAAVVSDAKIWLEPSSRAQIDEQIAAWRSSPQLRILGDDQTVWKRCSELARKGFVQGGRWYDARIAAVCVAHGVKEFWTVDRDYSRFPELRMRNPLAE